MARKNPHAVALGRRGGKANTDAQRLARSRNGRKGGRVSIYRFTDDVLERHQGDRWLTLHAPYDRAAREYLRRQR